MSTAKKTIFLFSRMFAFVGLGFILSALGVSAAPIIWSGADSINNLANGTNWSDSANWFGAVVPGGGDDAMFFDTGAVTAISNVNNTVDSVFGGVIGSLQYGNTNNFHTTQIGSGTLWVTNTGGLKVGTPGDPAVGKNLTNTITGMGGTLIVSNVTANIGINQANSVATPSRANLDLSGLSSFVVYANRIGIGDGQFPGVAVNNRAGGNLILARTNFISLAYTDTLANYQTAGKSSAIVMSRNSGNNPGIISLLQLGLMNTFYVDSINIGMDKSGNNTTPAHGVLTFNTAFAGQSPVANFYGAGGPGTRVTWWSVGDGNQSASSSNGGGGTNDFSLGTVNAWVDTMSLGRDAASASDTWAGPHKGVFTFKNGTVDVNTLILGNQSLETGTSTTASLGIINVIGAGAVLRVNNLMTLGTATLATAAGTKTLGILNVTNGAVYANNVAVGLNSVSNVINLANGTLIVTNTLATNAAGLFTLALSNSTLGLTVAANGSLRGLAQTVNLSGATNWMQLGSVAVLNSYPQTVPLVQYTTLNGAFNLGLASAVASAPGAYLTNLTTSPKSIALVIPNDPRPVIIGNPSGYSGSPGDNATFTVSVNPNSVAPLNYQWYFVSGGTTNVLSDGSGPSGSSTLTGSTAASLAVNNAQGGDSGGYFVIVTNAYGSATSSVANLTISAGAILPNITGPNDQTVIQGNAATFTASVTGNPTPDIQWQRNGTNINGATSATLMVTNVQYPADDGAVFSIIATNSAGAKTNTSTLTVIVPPAIVSQPTNQVVTNTQSASFTVAATGVPAVAYQWKKSGSPIAGATNATYTIASAGPGDTATYFCTITNLAGATNTASVTLIVNSTMSAFNFSPANGATGVCYDTPLYLTFSEKPFLRTAGKIRIFNATNSATPVETIDLSLNGVNGVQTRNNFPGDGQAFNYYPVVITGNTAAIYPPAASGLLTSNQTYYVLMDAGVFMDTNGAYFAGVAGTNTWQFTTKPTGPASPTNITVAADGSADFVSVQGAVDGVPSGNTTPTVINIRNGNYWGVVNISGKHSVTFRGQSRAGTIVIYPNNANITPAGTTHARMTFKVNANDVAIDNLTITNSTPQGGSQAEALMIESNARRCVVNNCEIDSRQDTILANANSSQAYFNNTKIAGNFDYIWGGGNLFFQNCVLHTVAGASGFNITAARTDTSGASSANTPWVNPNGTTYSANGFSFVGCKLEADPGVVNITLAGNNGTAGGLDSWAFCNIDTNAYVTPSTTLSNNYVFWQNQNMDLNGVNPVSFANIQTIGITNNDPRLLAATNVTTWFYGWTPQLAPNILNQPTNLTVTAGQTAQFTVEATGISAPAYQWLQNGTNAPYASANTATLVITNAQTSDAASYSVIVSNAAGSVTSSTVTLQVITPLPPTMSGISSLSNGGIQFTISGTQGVNYRVWASTNLALTPVVGAWDLLSSGTFGSAAVVFTDLQATNFMERFYIITVP